MSEADLIEFGHSLDYLNFPGQATYDQDKDVITLRYGAVNADVASESAQSCTPSCD